ncbi:RXRA [Bugula neritina]|uniref:RXRA n=1 Tax=Bugula neritina TaxID=10212 RepID=A0A7J7ITC7_BUGNE|nr:RXRA [Bugula neritina]
MEERQKNRDSEAADESHEPDTTDTTYMDMPVEQILEAELIVEPKLESFTESSNDAVTDICQAADKQLFTLVEWARRIPHFVELPVEDQAKLIRAEINCFGNAGWNELLIAAFSHRSVGCDDGILLATGLHVRKEAAQKAGVGILFDRVLNELVGKMRDMKIDKSELGCLRAIVLFNPGMKAIDHLTFLKLIGEAPREEFLLEMLESPSQLVE